MSAFVTWSDACDGLKGEIGSPTELGQSILRAVEGATRDEFTAFYYATLEIWQEMYDASTSGGPDERAAAALACYVYETVG